jgi:hypothetical protein
MPTTKPANGQTDDLAIDNRGDSMSGESSPTASVSDVIRPLTSGTEAASSDLSDSAYVERAWSGMPMIECKICSWSTLTGRVAFQEHYDQHHDTTVPPKLSTLVDQNGSPFIVNT